LSAEAKKVELEAIAAGKAADDEKNKVSEIANKAEANAKAE
jgi:hypothetical protein